MFDRNLWNAKRLLVETEIRGLKKLRSEPLQPHWGWKEIHALEVAKRNATALYIIRTHARTGKHTPSNWTPEAISKILQNELPQFILPDPIEMDIPPEAIAAMDAADAAIEARREAEAERDREFRLYVRD